MTKKFRDGALQYNAAIGCYVLKEPPPEYQWFIDLLALRYGHGTVRMPAAENFGRTQRVAVYRTDEKRTKEFGIATMVWDVETHWDIKEKIFEFLDKMGFPKEIPPVEEWHPISELRFPGKEETEDGTQDQDAEREAARSDPQRDPPDEAER